MDRLPPLNPHPLARLPHLDLHHHLNPRESVTVGHRLKRNLTAITILMIP
jgi:hypothetical protein